MAADCKKERVKDEGNQKLMHGSRTDFVRNLGTGEDILPPWDRVLLDFDPEGDGYIQDIDMEEESQWLMDLESKSLVKGADDVLRANALAT